jgi:aspartate dehydrogenase
MKTTMKIGIFGCGAIGHTLAQAIGRGQLPGAVLAGGYDIDQAKVSTLRREGLKTATTVDKLIAVSDLVVEAAGMATVPALAQAVLAKRKQLLVMSVGALLKHHGLLKQFEQAHCNLYFPSGAVAGLDALKAAKAGGAITSVRLRTTKPPLGLAGAPFFDQHPVDLARIKKKTIIFSGTAKEAVRWFPANINVAAAISLVGIGPGKTKVEIEADPKSKSNRHALAIEGSVGKIECITENVPSPHNPKTSFLATASVLALLKAIIAGERFGS